MKWPGPHPSGTRLWGGATHGQWGQDLPAVTDGPDGSLAEARNCSLSVLVSPVNCEWCSCFSVVPKLKDNNLLRHVETV